MADIPADFDFKTEADKLIIGCRYLADIDLQSLRLSVSRTHSLGPIVDPTKYREALTRGDMDDVARLAARAETLVHAYTEMRDRLIASGRAPIA